MSDKQPNIIVILTDDQGYGDLECYGHPSIKTPNVDLLAATGIRCTEFYAGAPWCVPSRLSLMTGLHPYRGGTLKENVKRLPERRTMPAMLRDQGYRTALLGKWHLGMNPGSHPLDAGFDYYYGTPASNDIPAAPGKSQNYDVFKEAGPKTFPVELHRNREVIEFPADQRYFTQRYTREATQLIEESGNEPFFIYLAHNMPHVPIFPSPDFVGKSTVGRYGDVIEELDWSVGGIVQSLEAKGIRDQTLIVYMSDNGPWTMFKEFGGSAGPLRGEKTTTWEGGPRVPSVINWPGQIAPRESDDFIVNLDLYATFARLAGAELPEGLDCLDMTDVLLSAAPSPREDYLFYINDEPSSYRFGDHKIHIRSIDRTRDPDTGVNEKSVIHDPPLLFDLNVDIAERHNIAAERSELLDDLRQRMELAHAALLGGNN